MKLDFEHASLLRQLVDDARADLKLARKNLKMVQTRLDIQLLEGTKEIVQDARDTSACAVDRLNVAISLLTGKKE